VITDAQKVIGDARKNDALASRAIKEAIERTENAAHLHEMPNATVIQLRREVEWVRSYDQDTKLAGQTISDHSVFAPLRFALAGYLDRLARLASDSQMVPKVSPLAPECWTSAPMSSESARESRIASLNRGQFALDYAARGFRLLHKNETGTAAVNLFRNMLTGGVVDAFFNSRGIKDPTSEQKKEIRRGGPLFTDFMQFGHCVLWMKDDYSDSLGPAT